VDRLIASRLALEAVLALDQRPEGLRLTDVAAILGVGPSSAQRALELLVSDGLVSRVGPAGRCRLSSTSRGRGPGSPGRGLPVETAIDLVCRASRAMEFAGRTPKGISW
jgi:hypothetical protein